MKHYDPDNPKTELIIGIASPAGTGLSNTANSLAELLRPYKYEAFQIGVSSLIKAACSGEVNARIGKKQFNERVRLLMNSADEIRKDVDSGAALVPLTVSRIRSFPQD